MNLAVLGLWHLGSVSAAGIAAAGHRVAAWDPDATVRTNLRSGKAPLAEPGLDDLLGAQIASGALTIAETVQEAVRGAEVIWITFDTPVDESDEADVESVLAMIRGALPHADDGAVVLISSQLPVGSTGRLEQEATGLTARRLSFACSPENLRLGNALAAFTQPDRVVVGVRDARTREILTRLFEPVTTSLEWMSVESAEMTKHAINAFLATSVVFINEVAVLCEQVGADAREVERGLKTERRIGPRAYLSPGGPFAGGTLARDVAFLGHLGEDHGLRTPLIDGIRESNRLHAGWIRRALTAALGELRGTRVAVWGLAYKVGTDTLRRSSSVELCLWLAEQGAEVVAADPAVRGLPAALQGALKLAPDAATAIAGADALVVATEWPAFRQVQPSEVVGKMRRPIVCDPNRFLASTLGVDPAINYVTVGGPRS